MINEDDMEYVWLISDIAGIVTAIGLLGFVGSFTVEELEILLWAILVTSVISRYYHYAE